MPINTQVPSWLERIARPADMSDFSRVVGQVGGTMLRRGTTETAGVGNGDQSFQKDLTESRLNQQDPLWKLKAAAYNTQIITAGARYQTALNNQNNLQRSISNETADQEYLTTLATNTAGDPDALLGGLSGFAPRSARGVQAANQMRMAATQGLKRKSDEKALSSFFVRANKLAPKDYATLMALPRDDNSGLPTPEAYTLLGTMEDSTKGTSGVTKAVQLFNKWKELQASGNEDEIKQFEQISGMNQPGYFDKTAYKSLHTQLNTISSKIASLKLNDPDHPENVQQGARLAREKVKLEGKIAEMEDKFAHKTGLEPDESTDTNTQTKTIGGFKVTPIK